MSVSQIPMIMQLLLTYRTAFSSTLARETAFGKEVWERRFADPNALTFVALFRGEEDDATGSRIISSLTLRGPFCPEPASNSSESDIHWEINAVYTDEEYRRIGIASAVLEEAIRHATSSSGRHFGLKAGVMYGNEDAKGLYEKAGFVVAREDDEGYELERHFDHD